MYLDWPSKLQATHGKGYDAVGEGRTHGCKGTQNCGRDAHSHSTPTQGAESNAVSKQNMRLFEATLPARAVLQDPRPVLPLHGQALP